MSNVRNLLFFFWGFVLFCSVWAELGCPPNEDIEPCSCQEIFYTDLKCESILSSEKIKQVFENATRYHFNKFTLKDSSLQYIPRVIFDDVEVKYLEFNNVNFIETFDEIPKNPGLEKIYLNKVKIGRRWNWSHLSLFTELKDLTLENIPMKSLSTDFRPNVSKKLQALRMSWCSVKKFRDDEFAEFLDLEIFTSTHNQISQIYRSMFARPSKLKQISFEYNLISSIPEDMFTEMSDLMLISFANNQLSLLPENIFKSTIGQIQYFRFQDNPFKCDCRMEWLVSYTESVNYLYGRCNTPKKLNGKNLSDLRPGDFRC